MAREINFLSERRRLLSKVEVRDEVLLRKALMVCGGVLVICAILTGVSVYFSTQLGQVLAEQDRLRGQIVGNVSVEKSFVIFVHKLAALTKIDQDRQEKNAAISYFSTIFGSNAFITSIEFNQKEKVLVFDIEADEVFTLKKIFDQVNSSEVRARFTSINPSNLERGEDGRYGMKLTVVTSGAPVASEPVSGVQGGSP